MSLFSRGVHSSTGDVTHSDSLTLATQPRFYRYAVKPTMDRIVGAILLFISLPILVVTMGLTRVFVGKPVLYRQTRIGLGGRKFELYKVRTMIPDRRQRGMEYLGSERRKSHKSKNDPRVLPFGKWLRTVRLDELPQLWNVVRGDMSLVGPRPELPEIVAGYEDWQHRRHDVTPGLTGLWQVSARNDKLMHECIDIDLQYIEKMSFTTDLMILIRTPAAIFRRRGY